MAPSTLLRATASIGADPADNNTVRLQKRLLVAWTLMMASAATLWGGIYYVYDEPLAASIPLSYAAASFAGLALFARIRRYTLFRSSQLFLSLSLPFLLMIALGGFMPSSGVVLWSLTSPLGALVLAGRRQALGWFLAYLALVVAGALLDGERPNNLPPTVIMIFLMMNIGGVSIVAWVVLQAFVSERDLTLVTLGRRHRWIREAFSSYVSPNLVRYLVDHPDALDLGGVRRVCSFVLSDIAGFTTLVERSDAARVVSMLNDYLEEMTRIVLAHGGTIGAIFGDAVSAIFSAPVSQPDHAQRAVACALEMDRFAVSFAAGQRRRGIPLGVTRIGVNTGLVIVGNVGSRSHFDYRALGDAINTTSRLESANRYLGTRVCVGQATVELCPGFIGRPLGTLMLKGKSQGVAAFEPFPAASGHDELLTRYKAAFDEVAAGGAGAAAAMAALNRDYPNDPVVAFYLDRLERGRTGATIVLEGK